VNSDQCTTDDLHLNCFWLYSSNANEINDGVCKAKNDTQLTCSSAQRENQCGMNDVDNLGTETCFWVKGNSSKSPNVDAICMEKVC
jgi:hypothetical protein